MRIFKFIFIFALFIGGVVYWFYQKPVQQENWSLASKVPVQSLDIQPNDFTLQSQNAQSVTLSDFKGRSILLHFWATWCPPCVDEMTELVKLVEKFKDKMVFLAVSGDQDWNAVNQFFGQIQKPASLQVLLNPSLEVASSFGTYQLPETYFISKDFKIIRKWIGPQIWTSAEVFDWFEKVSN